MLKHIVKMKVMDTRAELIFDFMMNLNDKSYSAWWPGEHLYAHIVKHGKSSPVGDIIYFNENLGPDKHIKFHAVVLEAERPGKIVCQMKKFGFKLPGWFELYLENSTKGITLRHEVKVGYQGWLGFLTDPLFALYFNTDYRQALEKHCREEWPRLALMLRKEYRT